MTAAVGEKSIEPSSARSIEELTETVSASRLSTWQQCRLRFFFRYIAGVEKARSPALHVGSTVHAVLQQWNKSRWRGEPFDLEATLAFFDRTWAEWKEGPDIDWRIDEETSKASAWGVLEHYFQHTPIPVSEKPEAVEVGLEADLASQGLPKLVGFIDLVRAGRIIVDFKTSSRSPDAEMVAHTTETQTTAYGLLYREATGSTESAIELHHLIKTKAPKLAVNRFAPVSEAQLTRLFHVMEAYVDGLDRGDFIPSPGIQCGSCEFFNECRAWSGGKEKPYASGS